MTNLDNALEKLDYDRAITLERNPLAVHIGTSLMSLMQPHILFEEGAPEEILAHNADGGVLGINMTHQDIFDQFNFDAIIGKLPDLFADLEGVARIMVKYTLVKRQPLKYMVEQQGGFGIMRRKDARKIVGRDLTEQELALVDAKQDEALWAAATMLDNGQALANFPQTSRDSSATRVRAGMGLIATRVSEETNLALLPGAMVYPRIKGLKVRDKIRPTMYFGRLIHGPFVDPDEVTQQLSKSMEACEESAKELAPHRRIYR